MVRRHILITGTGRSGTTFLVELLTHLGMDTGFSPENIGYYKSKVARAGLEHDIRLENAPYVVKSPWFCDHVDEVLANPDIEIDHVIIPMRDLEAAAESRRFVTAQTAARMSFFRRLRFKLFPKTVTGGVWHSRDGSDQENILLEQLYKLVLSLSKTTIPVTLMQFPRIVQDPEYLYDKLHAMLNDMPYLEFYTAFRKVARKELVHSFTENDRWAA